MHTLHGVIPALVTPRDNTRDDVDLDCLKEFASYLLSTGVHGIFPTSSTGEAASLTHEQRRRVIEAVAETVNGQIPVLAGAGAASTAESVRLARDAQKAGATHLAVLPLHFVPLSPDELYGYFAAVSDSVDIPTLLYNFPARTGGQNIPPTVAARLAAHHNVIGLKDSSGDLTNSLNYLQACGPDFAVFVGAESLIYPALAMGAAGTICSGANLFPQLMVFLYEAWRSGEANEARQVQQRLLGLKPALAFGTFPASVKAALDLLGLPVGDPFLPVAPLSAEQRDQMAPLLARIGAEDA